MRRKSFYPVTAWLILITLAILSPISARAQDAYTWADLKADVQTTVRGDLDWPDSVWLRLANMGIRNLATKTGCAQETITVFITTGTAEYPLPADFSKLWCAVNRYAMNVYERLLPESRGPGGTGLDIEVPKVYGYKLSKGGGTVGFYPTPVQDDSVLVYYFRKPTLLTADTDTVDVFDHLHLAVRVAFLIEVYEREERPDKGNRQWSLLTTEINNANTWINSLPPDIIVGPRQITRDH